MTPLQIPKPAPGWLIAVAVAAAFVALPHAAVPQQSPSPPPQFRSGVDLVRIDVSALDGKRRPVRGLTAADFTLRVDGRVQPILAFSAVDLPAPEPATARVAAWTRSVAPDVQTNVTPDEGRMVVIFFDQSIPPGPTLRTAKKIASAAVDELAPNDLAALISVRGNDVQNFTADRTRLMRTIAAMGPGAAPGADEAATNAAFGLSGLDAHSACYCNTCVLDQIRLVADTLRPVTRTKVLLFVGRDIMLQTADVECSIPVRDARAKMLHALDLSHVTIHSIDPSGLETGAPGASSQMRAGAARGMPSPGAALGASQGSIRVLPDRTGGRTVVNTNAPETHVAAVFAESASYYVIGFDAPPAGGPPASIDVKSNRRGVTVHAQRAYEAAPAPASVMLGGGDATGSAATTGALNTAITAVLPARGLPVTASVLPIAMPGTLHPAVLVVVELQTSPVASASGAARSSPARFDLLVGAFDHRSRPVIDDHYSVEVAGSARAYDVMSPLVVEPGTYEIRAGVTSQDGRAGSVVTYVDVPDFRSEPLSLSGVALSAGTTGGATAVHGAGDVLPLVPTPRRAFRPTEVLGAFLRVYQGGSDPPSAADVQVRILDTHDRQLLNVVGALPADRFGAERAAAFASNMPLSGLAPGEYLLSIGVVAGKHTARRDVRFTVEK